MNLIATHLETGLTATAKAAEAASLSAASLINSERAWVVVTDIIDTKIMLGMTGGPSPFRHFWFDLINGGKTAARLFGIQYRFHPLHGGDQLPDVPDYGGTPHDGSLAEDQIITGRVLIPGEKNGFISIPLPGDHTREQIESLYVRLYVYAAVRYFDSFSIERVNQFGYEYSPAEQKWVLFAHPRAYNTHT